MKFSVLGPAGTFADAAAQKYLSLHPSIILNLIITIPLIRFTRLLPQMVWACYH